MRLGKQVAIKYLCTTNLKIQLFSLTMAVVKLQKALKNHYLNRRD